MNLCLSNGLTFLSSLTSAVWIGIIYGKLITPIEIIFLIKTFYSSTDNKVSLKVAFPPLRWFSMEAFSNKAHAWNSTLQGFNFYEKHVFLNERKFLLRSNLDSTTSNVYLNIQKYSQEYFVLSQDRHTRTLIEKLS